MSPPLMQFSLCCCLIIPSKHFLQMEWKQRNEIGFLNFSLQIIQLSSNDILCRRSLEFSVHDPLDPVSIVFMVFEPWPFGLGDVIGISYLPSLTFKISLVRSLPVLGSSIMIGFFTFLSDCNVGLLGHTWPKEDTVVVPEGHC